MDDNTYAEYSIPWHREMEENAVKLAIKDIEEDMYYSAVFQLMTAQGHREAIKTLEEGIRWTQSS